MEDNAQYEVHIVPLIINAMKLFPCWSGIMRPIFKYGDETASSSRIESNFNNLKHRVFKNDNLPLRVDLFVEKLILFYQGDNLLLQSSIFNDNNCVHKEFVENGLINAGINEKSQETKYSFDKNVHNIQEDYIFNSENGDYIQEINICNVWDDVQESHVNIIKIREDLPISIADDLSNSHEAFKNSNLPSDLHKCRLCQKPVNLLVCSLPVSNTEKECVEKQLCLTCSETTAEDNARETWKKKSVAHKSKTTKSASSYLVRQPGFEHLDLNKKGTSSTICFLKNGNILKNKPIKISGVENKFVLSNTCAFDAIMTVLACSASDSKHFKSLLSSIACTNESIKFILNMLKQTGKKIYKDRLELLIPEFQSEDLLGGLKLLDVTDTATAMAKKILKSIPSISREINCTNTICVKNNVKKIVKLIVISVNVFNDEIDFQKELDEVTKMEEICECCMTPKSVSNKLGECIIFEINAIPEGKVRHKHFFFILI